MSVNPTPAHPEAPYLPYDQFQLRELRAEPKIPEPGDEDARDYWDHERDRNQYRLTENAALYGLHLPARGGVLIASRGRDGLTLRGVSFQQQQTVQVSVTPEEAQGLLQCLQQGREWNAGEGDIGNHVHVSPLGVMTFQGSAPELNTEYDFTCEHHAGYRGQHFTLAVSLAHLFALARVMARDLI